MCIRDSLYLGVRAGSRHLGTEVAEWYQREGYRALSGGSQRQIEELIAALKSAGRSEEIEGRIREIKTRRPAGAVAPELAYVEGALFDDYIHDMKPVSYTHLISVSFRFLALGGAAGSTTLDGLYLLSGMGNDPRLLTLNGCDVQDLSTGGRISDPLKLTMLQDFSSYEEGDNLRGADKVVISPESAASATGTGARGLTAPGSEGAVVLNSTELGGFATANNLIYEVFSPPDTPMNGLEGVMLYIRLPKGRPGDRYSLFHFTLFSYKNETPAWTNAGNAPVQILARRSDRWQTVTASDGNCLLYTSRCV